MLVEKEEARAGKTGVGVRYVLAVSLTLTILVMIAVYWGVI
jgi:hypothetical protein